MSSDNIIVDQDGLVQAIERMVRSLSVPLSNELKQEGWSDPARKVMLGFWKNLLAHVKSDGITAADLTTPPARGLDLWGVQRGELWQVGSQIFEAILRLADEGKINVDH